jgi:hypothetical protein
VNPECIISYIRSKYNISSVYKYNKCSLLYARHEYEYVDIHEYIDIYEYIDIREYEYANIHEYELVET